MPVDEDCPYDTSPKPTPDPKDSILIPEDGFDKDMSQKLVTELALLQETVATLKKAEKAGKKKRGT